MRLLAFLIAVFIGVTFFRISQLKKDRDNIESTIPKEYQNPVIDYLEGENEVKIEKIEAPKSVTTMVDERDGQRYKTVIIGDQIWLAENMRFKMRDASCYDRLVKNCEELGYLYTWSDAQLICPQSWRLPNDEDWNKLYKNLGRTPLTAFRALAEENDQSFNAKFAGWQNSLAQFKNEGSKAYFWSASSVDKEYAHYYMLDKSSQMFMRTNAPKKVKLSCRCVKDN